MTRGAVDAAPGRLKVLLRRGQILDGSTLGLNVAGIVVLASPQSRPARSP